jgi:hypothetical protein
MASQIVKNLTLADTLEINNIVKYSVSCSYGVRFYVGKDRVLLTCYTWRHRSVVDCCGDPDKDSGLWAVYRSLHTVPIPYIPGEAHQ